MGFFDLFKKKGDQATDDDFDPVDLRLENLRPGWLVDYDMQTWTVSAKHRYDFDGDVVDEWELVAGRTRRYLGRTEGDGVDWTWSKKIPVGMLGAGILDHVQRQGDPPSEINHQDKPYYLDMTSAGHFHEHGGDAGKPLIQWDFVDEDDEAYVTLEQWGETEFEAASGVYVEDWQFTNILPGGEENA
ncbi:MAG: DUF4178 domain-containing protein [Acidobacteriota bacterium]